MPPSSLAACLFAAAVLAPLSAHAAPAKTGLTLDGVNAAPFSPLPEPPAKTSSAVVLRAEILLGRARFSPGAIDGVDGENFRKAVLAYQRQTGLPASGHLDQGTWDRLVGADGAPVLVRRRITAKDAKGPFVKRIPPHMEAQAKLARLGYHDLTEAMAEQVHSSPALLKALNRGGLHGGGDVVVPQVVVERGAPATVARITVDKATHAVDAYGADGKLLAFYPASIGSTEKPAPAGQFVIEHVTHNPDYTYNPDYAFKGVTSKKPFTIAPGPNNPVGSVWMALSIEGYGIHGTPEPDQVGKTQSHGCIRMTNWDVEDLASMVKKGIPVSFEDQPVTNAVPAPIPASAPAGEPPRPAMPAASAEPSNPAPAPATKQP